MRYILLLISLFLFAGLVRGQSYYDEDIKLKKFEEKKWKEIVGNTNFEEDPEKKKEEDKPREPREPWFRLPGIDPSLLRAIAFAFVFGLFAFILYYVSRNTTLTKKNRKLKPLDAAAPVENIDELDTEGLLLDALNSNDLRLAVRVRYLLLLKKLNEAELIKWKKDKTNRDYLSELYGRHASYDDVRMLTLAYELVWYGERSVSETSFQKLSGDFESVNRRITEGQALS